MIVVDDLGDIGITRVSRWIFNCYVIHDGGEGHPVIVDAGMPSIAQVALGVVDQLGLPPVGTVLATHGHSDHVAGAATVAEATGASVHLPARTMEFLAGEPATTPGPRQVAKIWPVFLDQPHDFAALRELNDVGPTAGYGRGPMVMPIAPGSALIDGSPVPGAPDWTVIAGPGHTEDATMFRHEPTNTLLSGDTVLSADGRAWFNPEYVDADASAQTENRLRELRTDHLLPGHGRPVVGRRVLDSARSHLEVGRGGPVGSAMRWAAWLMARSG